MMTLLSKRRGLAQTSPRSCITTRPGGWPRLLFAGTTTEMAAPGFVVFEAWVYVLLKSREFSHPTPMYFSTATQSADVHASQPRRSVLLYIFQKAELRIRKVS